MLGGTESPSSHLAPARAESAGQRRLSAPPRGEPLVGSAGDGQPRIAYDDQGHRRGQRSDASLRVGGQRLGWRRL